MGTQSVRYVTTAWALLEHGRIDPYALRSRRATQLQAACRMMGAATFQRICEKHGIDHRTMGDVTMVAGIRRYWPCISALWREVKRRHPTARLVRVHLAVHS